MPSEDTAVQRFLPTGPLAVLAFAGGGRSIVWTLPDARAAQVLALDDDAFARELTRAFDARLGPMRVVSKRAAFPLRRQLAQSPVHGRGLVVGDAARSEERRVGNECVRLCRSRWWPNPSKQIRITNNI